MFIMFTNEELYKKVRWQFSLLFGVCGAQRTMTKSLCHNTAGFRTDHKGSGRCFLARRKVNRSKDERG